MTFRCEPLFFIEPGEDITVTASGTFVENPGNVAAEPVMVVTLNGYAEITIGGYLFELNDVIGEVTVDTPRQECYQEYTSKMSIPG